MAAAPDDITMIAASEAATADLIGNPDMKRAGTKIIPAGIPENPHTRPLIIP